MARKQSLQRRPTKNNQELVESICGGINIGTTDFAMPVNLKNCNHLQSVAKRLNVFGVPPQLSISPSRLFCASTCAIDPQLQRARRQPLALLSNNTLDAEKRVKEQLLNRRCHKGEKTPRGPDPRTHKPPGEGALRSREALPAACTATKAHQHS